MARRVSHRLQSPEDCPILPKTDLEKIKGLVGGLRVGPRPGAQPGETTFQPCAEYGRVTVEAILTKPLGSGFEVFDSEEMCSKLRLVDTLKNQKCSGEMGYGFAGCDDTHLHIFKTGRVIIRRAVNREQAVELLRIVKAGLWPSVICRCGNVASECVGGGCEHCLDLFCPGLAWGPKETGKNIETEQQKTFFERITSPSDYSNHNFLVSAWKHVNLVFETVLPRFFDGEAVGDETIKELGEAARNASMAIQTGGSAEEMVMGLALHGLIRDIGRIADTIPKLRAKRSFVDEAREALEQTSAVLNGGRPGFDIEEARSRCRAIVMENPRDGEAVEMYKLLSNCLFVARLMRRPIPGKPAGCGYQRSLAGGEVGHTANGEHSRCC